MAGLEDLYREIILDHYRSPRNRGELAVPPAHKVEGFNPLCGDEVVLYLDIDPATETVNDIKIEGQGCSISQASTSMMSSAVKGKPLDEVRKLIRAFKALMSIHESKLEGEADGSDLAVRSRRHPPRRPRGPAGRREVPGAHQVRHPGVEHAAAGFGRIRVLIVRADYEEALTSGTGATFVYRRPVLRHSGMNHLLIGNHAVVSCVAYVGRGAPG